ncbi:MAG: M20 family metallopeptidase [Firmicutes bacterium]|nr:M20 family metallopeptidase [Bacillota bacterium]
MINRAELKARVRQAVEDMAADLIALSHQIHQNPELGLQEFQSSKRLSGYLQEKGFQVERGTAGLPTAFRAEVTGQPGPKVAFLAEYDALPELGHACGHNIIGTAAVGAGVALSQVLKDVAGSVVVLGTPAEEGAVDGAGGKVAMVEKGIFADIDVAMLVHPSTTTGTGGTSLGRIAMEISFRGKPAHAAGAPHEGINALDAAIQTFNGINALRQHITSDARIHGIITKGGVSPNIVPEYAEMRLYVRAAKRDYLRQLEEKVKNCARGAALATGATVNFRYTAYTYEDMVTNQALAQTFAQNLVAIGRTIDENRNGGSGSTDMGNVSHAVPAVHGYIAIAPKGVVGHSHEFAAAAGSPEGDRGLLDAAKALAMTGVDFLVDEELRNKVREEFRQTAGA